MSQYLQSSSGVLGDFHHVGAMQLNNLVANVFLYVLGTVSLLKDWASDPKPYLLG